MVGDAEQDACADHGVSQMLADRDARDLARVVHLYSLGKMRFYGRAMVHFESK